jgi:hypothetical protein
MSKIIVSYRRSDSAAITGRIFDRLVDRYGEQSVFMDIDAIPYGTDFRHHIQNALRDADILLAVVGPSWLGKTADGRSRIQDEADPVRVEVEAALKQGLTVIPLLVDSATMPAAADLPESIRDFAYINAAPVDIGRDFRAHMERLARSIDGIIGTDKAALETVLARGYPDAPKASSWSARRLAAVVGSIAVILGAGIIAANLLLDRPVPGGPPASKQVSDAAPVPAPATPAPPPIGSPPGAGKAPETIARPVPPGNLPGSAPATYRIPTNVSGGVQNMRSGPALKYPIVVAVPAGATGIVLGACRGAEDNTRPWCQVQWGNYSGWISSCCIVDEKTGALPRVD